MGKRKSFVGMVISDKMNKTCVVKISRMTKHPKYSKTLKTSKKFMVHDENSAAKVGDQVRIEETRPISKGKHFRLIEVIKKASLPEIDIKEDIK